MKKVFAVAPYKYLDAFNFKMAPYEAGITVLSCVPLVLSVAALCESGMAEWQETKVERCDFCVPPFAVLSKNDNLFLEKLVLYNKRLYLCTKFKEFQMIENPSA